MEKLNNNKNIVYTFNNVLDVIEELDDINNSLLGLIKKENIKDIKISSFKYENEFERQIDEFLNKNNFKLCIIRFTASEGHFLNYIKFFIENKEKDFIGGKFGEKDQKKAFIFIVHMTRIFNYNLDREEKILKETISHLSGYYQIFIDDLNGKNEVTIDDMVNLKGKELFEKCLDFDVVLKRNIYKCLSFMSYKFCNELGTLNEEYVNKLINYIESDSELRKNLNKCIFKQMEKEEDIIVKVFKTENSVNRDDIDMISVIQRHLSELYLKKLYLLYFKAEKDQYFSTLLSNEENRKIIEMKKKKKNLNKIKEEGEGEGEEKDKDKDAIKEENDNIKTILKRAKKAYLEKLIFIKNESSDENSKQFIVEQPGENQLNIILGLKLPGLKPIISSIVKKFRNECINKYKNNENSLRERYELNEEEIKKKIEVYEKNLNSYNHSTLAELEKNEILCEIIKEEKSEKEDEFLKIELFDLFLDDYYLLFIDNNIENKNEIDFYNIRNFMSFLVKLRNDSNDFQDFS